MFVGLPRTFTWASVWSLECSTRGKALPRWPDNQIDGRRINYLLSGAHISTHVRNPAYLGPGAKMAECRRSAESRLRSTGAIPVTQAGWDRPLPDTNSVHSKASCCCESPPTRNLESGCLVMAVRIGHCGRMDQSLTIASASVRRSAPSTIDKDPLDAARWRHPAYDRRHLMQLR